MENATYKDLSKSWPEATIKRTFVLSGEGDYVSGNYPQGPWQAAEAGLTEIGIEDGWYEYTVAYVGKVEVGGAFSERDCFIVEVAV